MRSVSWAPIARPEVAEPTNRLVIRPSDRRNKRTPINGAEASIQKRAPFVSHMVIRVGAINDGYHRPCHQEYSICSKCSGLPVAAQSGVSGVDINLVKTYVLRICHQSLRSRRPRRSSSCCSRLSATANRYAICVQQRSSGANTTAIYQWRRSGVANAICVQQRSSGANATAICVMRRSRVANAICIQRRQRNQLTWSQAGVQSTILVGNLLRANQLAWSQEDSRTEDPRTQDKKNPRQVGYQKGTVRKPIYTRTRMSCKLSIDKDAQFQDTKRSTEKSGGLLSKKGGVT